MCSRNECQAIIVIERLRDVLPKGIPSSSRRYTPSTSIIGIRPKQITHGSLVWHLLYTVESSDVIKGIDAWGETPVEAEYLVVDEGGKREVVEEVGEVLPNVGIAVLSEALIVEAIDLRDLAGFVVATEDGDSLGVADLESNKEGDRLD